MRATDNTQKTKSREAAWFGATLAVDRSKVRTPRLIKVTEAVYCAHGYAISNVLFVLTETGVIVVDTTESQAAARAVLDDFRKVVSPLPVSHIIYTHFHGDHTRGAKAFHAPETVVIAHRLLLEEIAKKDLLLPCRSRLTAHQFGRSKKVAEASCVSDIGNGYVAPDITFDEKYEFEEGGVQFRIFHAPGETVDHLIVWLPQQRMLFPGDLFYGCFPMLSSPMRPDRPVLAWVESLERMRALRPKYLVPSHGVPVRGADEIDRVMGNYVRAIRHLHDETVERINSGMTLEQVVRQVRLPEELARLPYLRESYGMIKWAVKGIFRQYTGWYTFNPTDLRSNPPSLLNQTLLQVCGGAAPFIQRARKALRAGNAQLALELADIIIVARPSHLGARNLKIRSLQELARSAKNGVERNVYRAALDGLKLQPHEMLSCSLRRRGARIGQTRPIHKGLDWNSE